MSMAKGGISFNTKGIQSWIDSAPRKVEATIKTIAFGVYADVKGATPVDTGRARGGWLISSKGLTLFEIGNPVEYVPALEYGTSRSQKHVGFIRGVINSWRPEALRMIKEALK